MNEMQGAVGLAQLKKLDYVVQEQRKNAHLIQDAMGNLQINMRTIPDGSIETADSMVFLVANKQTAHNCRDKLVAAGLGHCISKDILVFNVSSNAASPVNIYPGNLFDREPTTLIPLLLQS